MNDPLLDWRQKHPNLAPPLDGEAEFHLDLATIRIRSNAPDVLAMTSEAFRYYPSADTPAPASLLIDVHYIDTLPSPGGLDPYAMWGDRVTPALAVLNQEDLSSGRARPVTIDKVKCLWRPYEFLASLPGPHVARILATDYYQAKDPGTQKPRLSIKGTPIRPESTPELVDLIKILYIRRCDLCCIHGASVAWKESGLIITGPSGSGKTTTALSLARSGFSLLSDELTLIDTHNPGTVRIRGLLVPPMVMGERLTDLQDLEASLTALQNGSKAPFELMPSLVRDARNVTVRPKAIVHLEAPSERKFDHEISTLPQDQSFARLSRQLLDLPGDDRRQFQFEALTSLLAGTRQYRLVLGRHLSSLPAVLRRLAAE